MSFNFMEIGEECVYNTIDVTDDGFISINNNITVKIQSIQKNENIMVIRTSNLYSDFGEHLSVNLNYMYLYLIIDTTSTTGDVMFGSKITYGYNKENSHADVLSQPLITTKLYNDLKERFDISYGEINVLSPFLNHMYASSSAFNYTSKQLEELCRESYPLKKMCKPLDETTLTNSYNWMIIRNTEKGPTLLEEVLKSILKDKKQNVLTHYSQSPTDLSVFKDIDIFIIITNDAEACYDVPVNSYCYLCPDAFYQSSRRLLRNLPKVLEWATNKNIPHRTMSIKSENGGCGGCNKEGGCCQDQSSTSCCKEEPSSNEGTYSVKQKSGCSRSDNGPKEGCCGGGSCGGCK
jgi:hypothetical protein